MYTYPVLMSDLTEIFKEYTGNKISLGAANEKIGEILFESISIQQMDDYLGDSFKTYKGVPELIDWCQNNDILFMINTTGTMRYFQRIFANNLLPKVFVISANALIRYPYSETDTEKCKCKDFALRDFLLKFPKFITPPCAEVLPRENLRRVCFVQGKTY